MAAPRPGGGGCRVSAAAPGIGRGLATTLLPWLLLPVVVLAGLATFGGSDGFVALTMTGLAVGSAYFLMASGLTLIFGLTGNIDFGHGAFVALGAFVAAAVLAMAPGLLAAPDPLYSLALLGAALLAAIAATALAGWLWQRIGARQAGATLPRLVILGLGGLIVAEQLIAATWGGGPMAVAPPEALRGAVALPGARLRAIDLSVVAAGLG